TVGQARYVGYVQPIVEMIHADKTLEDKAFVVVPKDNLVDRPFPMLAKTRLADSRGVTVLLQLKKMRHWGEGFEEALGDMPFDDKETRLVFRGATTGKWPKPDVRHPVTGVRYRFAKQLPTLVEDKRIDAGFTLFEPHVAKQDRDELAACGAVCDRISVAEQLQCKYLLSLEGHDVASGLKWMLASNSVVLTTRPRYVSWLMEDTLVPYKHYVPIKDDLSDISQQLDWCEANPDRCREIAAASTEYMQRFLDPEFEQDISCAVLRTYGQRVKLVAKEEVYPGFEAANLSLE
ncbi:MAG: glycosyl transferase family 90, partial [Pseudomonadota bacterium]